MSLSKSSLPPWFQALFFEFPAFLSDFKWSTISLSKSCIPPWFQNFRFFINILATPANPNFGFLSFSILWIYTILSFWISLFQYCAYLKDVQFQFSLFQYPAFLPGCKFLEITLSKLACRHDINCWDMYLSISCQPQWFWIFISLLLSCTPLWFHVFGHLLFNILQNLYDLKKILVLSISRKTGRFQIIEYLPFLFYYRSNIFIVFLGYLPLMAWTNSKFWVSLLNNLAYLRDFKTSDFSLPMSCLPQWFLSFGFLFFENPSWSMISKFPIFFFQYPPYLVSLNVWIYLF